MAFGQGCQILHPPPRFPYMWFSNPIPVYNYSLIEGILFSPQSTTTLIKKFGYPAEVHQTVTEDGYLLELHRIPYGKINGSSTQRKYPVLLTHGIACTSLNWILNTAEVALPYQLADAGYDVWLGNFRGNKYSNRHLTLKKEDSEFWDFSFHEMGVYDIPATVDFILKSTGQSKLMYVGHSMGTTAFFVSMSLRPEYNDKIKGMFALAPVVHFNHLQSTTKLMIPVIVAEKLAFDALGDGELVPSSFLDPFKIFGSMLCQPNSQASVICDQFIFHITGSNPVQFNKTWIPILFRNFPDSFSTRTVIHYVQQAKSECFCQFSYGRKENLNIYGTTGPPSYDLTKITAPVAIYWSAADWLASPPDVRNLTNHLPNVIENYRVRSDTFGHMDFVLAINSDRLVYQQVIDTMNKVDATPD